MLRWLGLQTSVQTAAVTCLLLVLKCVPDSLHYLSRCARTVEPHSLALYESSGPASSGDADLQQGARHWLNGYLSRRQGQACSTQSFPHTVVLRPVASASADANAHMHSFHLFLAGVVTMKQ